jgi:hypothetical protein
MSVDSEGQENGRRRRRYPERGPGLARGSTTGCKVSPDCSYVLQARHLHAFMQYKNKRAIQKVGFIHSTHRANGYLAKETRKVAVSGALPIPQTFICGA